MTDFTDLPDTPANYGAQAGKVLRVNSGETALEFVDYPVFVPVYATRVYRTNTFAFASPAATMEWDTLSPGSVVQMWNAGAPTRITIQASGWYDVGFSVRATEATLTGTPGQASIQLNGDLTATGRLCTVSADADDTDDFLELTATTAYNFTAADYIEVYFQVAAGASWTLAASIGSCFYAVKRGGSEGI